MGEGMGRDENRGDRQPLPLPTPGVPLDSRMND